MYYKQKTGELLHLKVLSYLPYCQLFWFAYQEHFILGVCCMGHDRFCHPSELPHSSQGNSRLSNLLSPTGKGVLCSHAKIAVNMPPFLPKEQTEAKCIVLPQALCSSGGLQAKLDSIFAGDSASRKRNWKPGLHLF